MKVKLQKLNPLQMPRVRKLTGRLRRLNRKKVLVVTGLVTGLFLVANFIIFAYYQNRVLPNSTLAGQSIGNKSFTQVRDMQLLPSTITFTTNYLSIDKQVSQKVTTKELGMQINWDWVSGYLKEDRSWLPLANLFGKHTYYTSVDYDQKQFDGALNKLSKTFNRASVDWTIDVSGDSAKLVAGKNGYSISKSGVVQAIQLYIGEDPIWMPLDTITPKVTSKDLEPVAKQLTSKQAVELQYSYNGTTKKVSSKDILSWYDISGTKASVNSGKVSAYISSLGTGLGIRVQNLSQLTVDTVSALDKQTKLSVTLVAAPKLVKNYTFCVRARNVSEGELPAFAAKLTSTLNDPRGWSLDGQVSFTQVESGCNMVAWLSSATDMPSFGAICDSDWSCTVSPNVIINYDRWRYASDAWNGANGSLDDYRSMVINHESGHWLGFDHRYCGGAGQPAPVMQQQSISLQGCTFNPWPNEAEKNTLKAQLGI